MTLNKTWYDRLKWIVTVLSPAVATLIVAFGAIFGFNSEPIVAAIVAVTAFLGSIFMISSTNYQKQETRAAREVIGDEIRANEFGHITVAEDEGGKIFTLDIGDRDPESLKKGDVVGFVVD